MTHNKPYLQPYGGRSTRHSCPRCGSPHSFTYYLDGDTGAVIHPTVGKCDREVNCCYHYTPKQFFEDNPDRRATLTPAVVNREFRQPEPPKEPGRISKEYIVRALGYGSNFVEFLCRIFDTDTLESSTVQRLMSEYYFGQTREKSIIFWQIDIQGRIRTGKMMLYSPATGKRVKDHAHAFDWVHARLKREGKLPDDFNLVQCLFGEHLLRRRPDAVVALVESEKSAIIGSGCFPDYIWLATGGRSQMSPDKVRVLRGRTVVMFPDTDTDGKTFALWCEKARELEAIGCRVTVSDLLERNATPEDREAKIDLADWLIRQLKASAPEPGITGTEPAATPAPLLTLEEKALQHLCGLNHNVQTLIDTLGLVSATTGKELRIIN